MKKFYKTLCKGEQILCGICLSTIIVLVFISAIARAIGRPISWVVDVSQFLLAWTAFLGADMAFRENRILGVDLVTKKLPLKVQALIRMVVNSAILAVLLSFVYFGIKLSIESRLRVFQSIHVSYSFVTISLPVMAILMSTTVLINMYDCFKVLLGKGSTLIRKGEA